MLMPRRLFLFAPAPALAQANIGIAVQGATDAARSSADLVLTEPGLSPIFTAIVESRKIFKRLRSYIIYRMASTLQIVIFLTVLIFAYNEELAALYVVLLALLNDLTMLMVAYDNASPSVAPDVPTLDELITVASFFGVALTLESFLFYHLGFDFLSSTSYNTDDAYRQACIYYQIAVAIELVVLSTRTKGFFFMSLPSWQLLVSIAAGLVVITILVVFGWLCDRLSWFDLGTIWAFDLVCFVIIDALKVLAFAAWNSGFGLGRNGLRLPTMDDITEDNLEDLPLLKEPHISIRNPHSHDISLLPNYPGALVKYQKPRMVKPLGQP
jgi:H+-transporting ATPase